MATSSRRSFPSKRGFDREEPGRDSRSRNGSDRRASSRIRGHRGNGSCCDERESARISRRQTSKNTTLIFGAAGGAAVLLILLIALASGSRRPARPLPRPALPNPAPVAGTIDWYTEGFNQGLHWKNVMSNRSKSPTPEEVEMVADRMTSNYTKKGITSEGEKRFIEGFRRAALGQ